MNDPPKCSNVECDNEGWKGTLEVPMCRECDAAAAHGVSMKIVVPETKEDQTMNKKEVHLCGAPTKKDVPCKNPVSGAELLCHHHIEEAHHDPEPTLQIMIDTLSDTTGTKEDKTMLPVINNGNRAMHYMIMTLDEFGNPLVLRRVFTNMDHYPANYEIPDNSALIPCDTGEHYSMAFMEEFLGDTPYWVEFLPIWGDVDIQAQFPNAALAWADEQTATVIILPDYPYWGGLEKAVGLRINPGPKLAKRLKEVTRVSRYFRYFRSDEISVHVYDADEVEHYDGQTIVRRSFLTKLSRNTFDRGYLRHNAKSGSFRLLGEFGLIKGDFIVAHDDKDIDADVVTHRENVKSEIRLVNNGVWGSCFLHHDHHTPVTDIQSLSWLGEIVFPLDRLDEELRRVGMDVLSDLRKGVFPKYMETYSDLNGQFDLDDPGTINDMKLMYNRWTSSGRGLDESAYFLHMIGTGFLNKMRSGMAFPIPWAVYGHVTTHEMLWEAGHYTDESFENKVFYHEATGRISVPGKLFKSLFTNHGGWDLDDSVRVLIRDFGDDGVKAIILRSPNAYGEYSIVDIDLDSFLPVLYNTVGNIPVMNLTVKEFKRKINPIQRVDKKVTYNGMPDSGLTFHKQYPIEDAQAVVEAMSTSPGVGRWANAQMVYYATFGTFRKEQLAHTEDIVDTLTQSVNPDGFAAIEEDISNTWKEIMSRGKAERYFMYLDKRVPEAVMEYVSPTQGHLTNLFVAHRLYLNRFAEILVKVSNHERSPIVMIHELSEPVSDEYMERAKKAEAWFRGLADKAPKSQHYTFDKVEGSFSGASRLMLSRASRKFWRDANRTAVKTILSSGDPSQMVIALYQWTLKLQSYKRTNGIDRILFAPNHEGEASVMDLLLSVLDGKGSYFND